MNRASKVKNIQKPRNVKYVVKRLGSYLALYKGLLIVIIILTILSNLFALVGPKLSGLAIDQIDFKGHVVFEKVYYYATLMIIFYVLSSVFAYLISLLMMKISKKIIYKMRFDAFETLSALPISYYDNHQIGDIISRMSYDIDTVNTALSSDVITIATSIITVVGSLVMMITISGYLLIVFVITIPISILFTRFMLKKTHSLFKKRSQTLGDLNGYIEEMVTGNKTIKAYGKEKKVIEKFDYLNNTATNSAYKAEYYGSITGPGVNFVNNLSLALICIFGTLLNIYQGFSLGKISSFVLYSRKFSGPINEIANLFTDLQSALAAAERVFTLIDAPREKQDDSNAIKLDSVDGVVEFKGVDFGYLPNEKIIHNLSFSALKGKIVALVGPTGAGKTTIVNLLMRFYDCDSGKILLDNHDIYNIQRKDLRKSYAMVLQDTWLFQGTIYENIKYGCNDATKEDVIKVAKIAKIHNFIETLPQKYDTILVEGGANISKGQKQLLTIARAMLLNAKMLILDEATSNVDTQTEQEIQAVMQQLMQDKTCFIIAHRLSTIKNADLILVINNGDIVEDGTHEQLLMKKGVYYELYNSQFK